MTPTVDFKKVLQEFYDYLSGILNVYDDTLLALQEELSAISSGDIILLNANLKKQQAMFLKTKLFSQRVDEYNKALGLDAANLTELTTLLSEEDSLPFRELLLHFDSTAKEISFYRDQCKTLLQIKLHHIDKSLAAMTGPGENTTYGRDAVEIQSDLLPKSFHTKI